MILKYLELSGFKSFPDRTRIEFGSGLTAVVGPNGSGKSNISDAVRWVLGEQSTKTLRGEKMEDVIFSGTKSRKAQGFAEVSLIIDNTDRTLGVDSDEVVVTRRYDRSGDSEYMLNRSTVRLRDIQEIFMDTGLGRDGYSLVGQGRIAEIVQSKSTQRREIFEEAAGIAKFRYRKNEAERSLTRAEDNLARLRDIVSELENRLEPLRIQAEKAKRYIELFAEKKKLEISIWTQSIDRANRELKDQSDRLLVYTQKRDALFKEIEETEQKIQQAFERMQLCNVKMDELRRERDTLNELIASRGSDIAVYENDIRHNTEQIKKAEKELAQITTGAEQLRLRLETSRKEAETVAGDIKAIAFEESAIEEQRAALRVQTEENSREETELLNAIHALSMEKAASQMEINSAKDMIEQLHSDAKRREEAAEALRRDAAQYREQMNTARALIKTITDNALSMTNTQKGLRMKLDTREQKLTAMKQDVDRMQRAVSERRQKQELLRAMEQSLEGYGFSVKEVLKRAKNGVLHGVCGTVSQIIKTDDEYAIAIETAISGALQNIITENENDAKAAIRLLDREKLGRATFLPITSVRGSRLTETGLDRYAGYVGLAADLVQYDERYRGIIDSLLGRVVVADDLDTASLIAKKYQYKFRVVSLDGQVINAGGSFTGGSRNKSTGLLSRKNEIDALGKEIDTLRKKADTAAAQMQSVEQEANRLKAELTAAEAELVTMNEDRIRAESEEKRLLGMIAKTEEQLSDMQADEARRVSREKSLNDTVAAAEKKMRQIEALQSEKQTAIDALRIKLSHVSTEREKLRDAALEFAEQRTMRTQELALLKQRIQITEENLNSDSDNAKRYTELCNALKAQNEELNRKITALRDDTASMLARIQAIGTEIDEQQKAREAAEASSTELRRAERSLSDEREAVNADATRLEERCNQLQRNYDELIEKLWTEYELTRNEAQRIAEPIEDLSRANSLLMSLRSKIRALGSVNTDAIEEYREVSERHAFMTKQIADAEKSRNELLRLIDDLTAQMKSIFAENFEQINTHFKRIFVELFGGGQAQLKMTDPDDVLETGIEIFVEPPGKVIKNLSSLSGGEQAFVAIAIYFAILKVHPAPFCILDEIEAALDDVNVDKYAAYLRTLSDKTQFIAITHRRGTMEAADILYGVTMQEEGVSKLLKMQVNQTAVTNLFETK